jgi:hypothetical protein
MDVGPDGRIWIFGGTIDDGNRGSDDIPRMFSPTIRPLVVLCVLHCIAGYTLLSDIWVFDPQTTGN